MMDDFYECAVGGKFVCSSENVISWIYGHALAERMQEQCVETFLH